VTPIDFYGTIEALILAAGCQGQTGMDILEDLVVLEVVDEYNQPVPPGVPGHKVLLTNLVNRAQPLLRYELTDSVTLAGGPNPLGLPYARIAAVDSRSDDVITLPGRAEARSRSTRSGCGRRSRGCWRSASTRSSTTRPGCTWPSAARGRPGRHPGPGPGRPGRRAPGRRRGPAPIEVTPVPRIDRDPGHGAKFKLVRSRPAPSP
jgi:phenylacetate-CoA ligase